MTDTTTPLPPVVDRDTWTAQVNELRVRETAHTCEGRADVKPGYYRFNEPHSGSMRRLRIGVRCSADHRRSTSSMPS
jgi:hypothetical protein